MTNPKNDQNAVSCVRMLIYAKSCVKNGFLNLENNIYILQKIAVNINHFMQMKEPVNKAKKFERNHF